MMLAILCVRNGFVVFSTRRLRPNSIEWIRLAKCVVYVCCCFSLRAAVIVFSLPDGPRLLGSVPIHCRTIDIEAKCISLSKQMSGRPIPYGWGVSSPAPTKSVCSQYVKQARPVDEPVKCGQFSD